MHEYSAVQSVLEPCRMLRLLLRVALSCLCLAAQGVAAEPSPRDPQAKVRGVAAVELCRVAMADGRRVALAGDVACFAGEIDRTVPGALVPLLERAETLVVSSQGGDVEAALDVAAAMVRRRTTLVVHGLCLSSCANYWFTAAAEKIVLDGSVVGWKGGPSADGVPSDLPRDERDRLIAYANAVMDRSDAFLRLVGVDRNLIYRRPVGRTPPNAPYWTVPPEELVSEYGVRGVTYHWWPDGGPPVEPIHFGFVLDAGGRVRGEAGSAVCGTSRPPDADVWRVGAIACFVGDITGGKVARLLGLGFADVKLFVVNSTGGEVDPALDVADAMLAHGISLIVDGVCLSSCANYWFLAARRKVVLENAFVGWHGIPRMSGIPDSADAKTRAALERTVVRSDAFFVRVGVHQDITGMPPEAQRDPAKDWTLTFWTWPVDALHGRWMVPGIVHMRDFDPSRPLRSGLPLADDISAS